ncbi:carbohydrate esterase family 1 protein [Mollisia scopiformis]|uniref:feruloyl esterase n=1 Tax=Mollisia scopiformis TaxID=149040 RepID=A0A194XCD3_MOLSC|nr:carbohydrate esterase family 1 protein [Mollisia scopiformis]KUJ17833.1 carbohydrate esterase family 1 protein [Mollisia scopiformis]
MFQKFIGLLRVLAASSQLQPFQNITIQSSGIDRYYLLTLPPNFDSAVPTPVIFSFHGGGDTANEQFELSQISNPEFNDFAIAVYPNGIKKTWEGVPKVKTNDIQFTSDIITNLSSKYTIDTSRIFATGKSDGGGFCNVLACDPVLSTQIAAFAPVSGAFYVKNETACKPETITIPCNPGRTKIPMLEFHGGEDNVIRYDGGGRKKECLPSIPHWIHDWARRDGLSVKNESMELKGTNDTVVYEWGSGDDEGLVKHVFDSSIKHDWPSTVNSSDNTRTGHERASFNATPIIIEFFKKHQLA